MGVGVNHGVERSKYPSYPALASGERLTTENKTFYKTQDILCLVLGKRRGGGDLMYS